MERINVVSIIIRELKNRHISHSDVARKLTTSPSTIQGMLSRPTLQVNRLIDLSMVCNYNFFREVAELLPYEEPVATKLQSVAFATNTMNERIKELEMEVKILRQTLKDIVAK
jgi:hypothetical protein